MSTGWNSQTGGGSYAIQFETDNPKYYKKVADACAEVMDEVEAKKGKPIMCGAKEMPARTEPAPSEFYHKFNGKKINILGTEYTIHVVMPNSRELEDAKTTNGFIETYTKEIFVCDHASMTGFDKKMYRHVEEFCMKILRHEIVHGVLFESGHPEWYDKEDLVDMLAYLMPKFIDIMSVQLPVNFFDRSNN